MGIQSEGQLRQVCAVAQQGSKSRVARNDEHGPIRERLIMGIAEHERRLIMIARRVEQGRRGISAAQSEYPRTGPGRQGGKLLAGRDRFFTDFDPEPAIGNFSVNSCLKVLSEFFPGKPVIRVIAVYKWGYDKVVNGSGAGALSNEAIGRSHHADSHEEQQCGDRL